MFGISRRNLSPILLFTLLLTTLFPTFFPTDIPTFRLCAVTLYTTSLGVATLSISYYDIGYTAGEMAYQVLAEGEDISTMEIQTAPEVTKMYNPTICEELGITVPDDYEAIETE